MMNKHLFSLVFAAGALVLLWIGAGFVNGHLLALAMTLLIAAAYGLGSLELHRFRQSSHGLAQALQQIPDGLTQLGSWLVQVPAELQNPVRQRIEGERVGLPGPTLTPYLVGLLVMLGMLGTFLGMVLTLNGAAFTLESSTDLQAIRSAFATPIKGLGLAFGTSVAGVASSAMLGLLSALCRRERMQVVQQLESCMASQLAHFSLRHQRQQAFQALQVQAHALPAVVDTLQAMVQQMAQMQQQLNQGLLDSQDRFHREARDAYTGLAESVDQTLRHSLTQSAQAASDSIRPALQAAMDAIAQETSQMQQGLASAMEQSLERLNSRFAQRSDDLLLAVGQAYRQLQGAQDAGDQQRLQAWTAQLETIASNLNQAWQQAGAQTLAQQQALCDTLAHSAQQLSTQAQASHSSTQADITRLVDSAQALVQSRLDAEAQWTQQHGARMEQLGTLMHTELAALRDAEAERGQAAVDRLAELQSALTEHLSTLGCALEAPITRLIQTASEAPRAAAEVIGQLRQEISHSMARDNALLEERSRIMETLSALLDSINHASGEQRAVIDSLVASAAVALNQAGSQFSEQLGAEAGKLAEVAAQVSGSALEVSSLGESFAQAVQSFQSANEQLLGQLQRIETAMNKSMLRSDDQLADYVAQARDLIELSVASQKDIVDSLRELSSKPAAQTEEVA